MPDHNEKQPSPQRGYNLSPGKAKGSSCGMLMISLPPLLVGLLWVAGGASTFVDITRTDGIAAALEDTAPYRADLFLGSLMLAVASAFLFPHLYSTHSDRQAARASSLAEGWKPGGPQPEPAERSPSLGSYLLKKRGELADLELKDVVMSKTILDVHRHKRSKALVAVPLFHLHRLHAIDRDSAIAATAQRAATLRAHTDELRAAGTLTAELLQAHLPSISHIKVVPVPTDSSQPRKPEEPGAYIAFEGNGRIAALQAAFAPEDGLRIEVEVYEVDEPKKIQRRLDRVRRWNGMQPLIPASSTWTPSKLLSKRAHGGKQRGSWEHPEQTYHELLAMLDAAELPVDHHSYEASFAGCWTICLDTTPTVEVLADGRDRELVVTANDNRRDQLHEPKGHTEQLHRGDTLLTAAELFELVVKRLHAE